MKTKFLLALVLTALTGSSLQAAKPDSLQYRYFLSTSLWSLANLGKDPADFYELNLGYRITARDALILNATTWKYQEPLGIPYGNKDKNAHTEDYPGYIRAYGMGVIYQRYVWKHFYTNGHANVFLQEFFDAQQEKIQSGVQLYLQFRVGYKWEFLNRRLFLEPALSFCYWPVNTNFPEAFRQQEKDWNNYFLFEPHLNFGFNF